MAEREHFTNGRCAALGTGVALVGTSFTAHIGNWNHWISIGVGYGTGFLLVLIASILITKSYYSREHIQPKVRDPIPSHNDAPETVKLGLDLTTSLEIMKGQLEACQDQRKRE